MPATNPLEVEALPRLESSKIKQNWGAVAREVKAAGRVAVTTHKQIEFVMISAAEYRSLMDRLTEAERQKQAVLDQLSARFDQRLASLQEPDATGQLDNFFGSQGRLTARPKAGTF